MEQQPIAYERWKSEIRGTWVENPPDSDRISFVEMTIPPMPGTHMGPFTDEDFIHYIEEWDSSFQFRLRHQENERWTRNPLQPGQLMLLPRRYHFMGVTDTAMTLFSVGLHRAPLGPLLNDYFTGDPESLQIALRIGLEHAPIDRLMRALKQAYRQQDQLAQECLGQTLGLYLFLDYGRIRPNRRPGEYRLTPWQRRRLDEYIQAHIDRKITLSDLAQTLSTSRAHLTRMVRRSTGVPPHQYVLEHRLTEARRLLQGGQHTIAEVASLTGFTDHSHLNRVFRKRFGVPPSNLLAR